MAEPVRGVSALQNELEKAKESLKDVDENIKKLTGRDPMQRVPQRRVAVGAPDRGGRTAGADSRLFNLARRGIIQEDTSPVKRRGQPGGAFARLGPMPGRSRRIVRGHDSGDEDELPNKPALQSSVIATSREERSRQNSIEEQSRDRKGQARNRRMFGLLLGTLQKFKDDAAVSKEKEEQRQKIEKKLEEKFKQEKEEIIKERRQLFLERKQKQFRIRLLEQKMEMARNHEDWERESQKLKNFIITKAKPCLFYLPKILTDDTEAKLEETKEAISGMIEMRRKKMEEEIAEMMNQAQRDERGMEEEQMDDGEMDGESGDEHTDDKENEERERHLRMKRERDEHLHDKEDLEEERERRDRERVQRDRDRQYRDRSGEGRKGREYRERSGDRSKEDRKRERDNSDGRKDRERDRQRDKDSRRNRSRSGKSRSRERERHRSGKSWSERRRDHSDEEKSRGHGSSSKKRKSREGKVEKREKVWEPMEDEVEEEFVGSSEKPSIASKMMEMAGMSEAMKLAKAAEELKAAAEFSTDLNTAAMGEAINLEDIPRPSENGGAPKDIQDKSEEAGTAQDDSKDQSDDD